MCPPSVPTVIWNENELRGQIVLQTAVYRMQTVAGRVTPECTECIVDTQN